MKKRYIISGIFIIVAVFIYRGMFMGFGVGLPDETQEFEEQQSNQELTASVINVLDDKVEAIERFEITGDAEIDEYITRLAEERGYQRQIVANEEDLEYFHGQALLPEAIFDFQSLQEEMDRLGMNLILVSGYRTPERQREIFLNKLGEYNKEEILTGEMDEKIDSILSQSSIPGYSKHHSGLAIDVGCDNYVLDYSFTESSCYGWLSDNDFQNSIQYNFFPSYPFGVEKQGPNPEPWEFVWQKTEAE